MGSSGRRTHPVMPARPSDAPITLRNPRRETESTHSEAPLGNSRCRASWKSSAAGEFFEAAPVFRARFFGGVVGRGLVDARADGVQVQFFAGADIFALARRDFCLRHSSFVFEIVPCLPDLFLSSHLPGTSQPGYLMPPLRGLVPFLSTTPGLRRELDSFAASRPALPDHHHR